MTTDQLPGVRGRAGAPAGLAAASPAAVGAGARREAVAAWLTRRWPLLASGALLAVLLDVLVGGALSTVADLRLHAAMAAVTHSGPDLVVAHVLDHTGQRWLVTPVVVAAAVWVWWRRRSWSSLWLVLGTLLTMNVVIAAAKFSLARGLAVTADPALFVPGGQAFPSGHAANAASAAALLVVLVARARGRRLRRSTALLTVLVPSAVMTTVSLYLGFHWFTDLLAGTLLGVLVVRAGVAVERRAVARAGTRAGTRAGYRADDLAPAPVAAGPARLASARAADAPRAGTPDAQLRRRPGAAAA